MKKALEKAKKANELRKSNECEKALPLYQQSWSEFKDGLTGAGLLHCLRKLKRLDEALPLCNELLQLYPSLDWVKLEVSWILAGKSLKECENYEKAVSLGNRIEKLNDSNLILKQIAFKLAKLAENSQQWSEVINWLKKVDKNSLSINLMGKSKWTDRSLWNHNMAKGLLNTGQYKDVISLTDESITNFPQLKKFFLRLKARALNKLERFSEAETIYQELVKYQKEHWIYAEYGEVLENLGKNEEGLTNLYKAAASHKKPQYMVNVYYKIGLLCTKLGKKKEAFHHFVLCKLIRAKEGWSVSDDLENNIRDLQNDLPDEPLIEFVKQAFSQCQNYWEKTDSERTAQIPYNKRKFTGTISLGAKNRPYCFINSSNISIYCKKSILPPHIRNQDNVTCEAIPSFDKKKNKQSWRAIKVRKLQN